ncbi:hypothetical protein GJQ57_21055 [Ralstonia pickettii]|uniref:Uncharacterized protein n=1 Tax=Ralstonia pickettii TaxID=329 RepID=A0A7X2HR39_RALPI|nr:hypothetical protein [Ralstonia pickettii]MRT01140.1 hypothetical protein [Ralstonia pickettii]
MIRTRAQIKLMALGLPPTPCNFGGDSSSQANTTNQNIDQKIYADNGSVAGTASGGGSVTINTQLVDHGATQASFGLAHDALADVTSMATASQSASQHTAELALSGALSTLQGSQQAMADAYKNASDQVAAAYQDSKTGNQRVVVIGALVVVGLVALGPLLKKAA